MTKQTMIIQTRKEQVNGDMSKVKTHRIAWSDLHDTFKKNWQTSSTYEISFTLTYRKKYQDVFEDAEDKANVLYDGQWYVIQQRTPGHDDKGVLTQQITATHSIIDKLKNIRADTPQPTEQSPQTVTLDSCLKQFTDGNDQGVTYQLHGNFPQAAVKVEGSLYEWLDSNLKLFGGYWVPNNNQLEIYDAASFKHPTGKQFRYQNNMDNVSVQIDTTDLINDCDVYGGKMEKDIQNAGVGNGINEAVNGDWTPVIKNAGGAQKWLAVARSYVGIPYVWGGGHSPNADPRNGMDCSGLGEQIARACGLNIGYGNTVSLEQGSTDISRDQVQTGDMGFYGSPGNSTHVVWAMDNDTYIAEPDVGQTCYIGKINDYPANFWKRNPQIASFVGNGASSGGGDSTTETYYALHFHYSDQDSIKKYGLHRGPQLIVDSIYDMDALKKYADNNIQHDPKTTITISNTKEHANQGDVWRFIDPEMNINTDVTVMGVNEGDDYFENSNDNEISLDNTALAMRNINATLLGQFKSLNNDVMNSSNDMTVTSQRQENHFRHITEVTQADMNRVKALTGGIQP